MKGTRTSKVMEREKRMEDGDRKILENGLWSDE